MPWSEPAIKPNSGKIVIGLRLGLTLAIIGTLIGFGGMAYAAFWIYTHLS